MFPERRDDDHPGDRRRSISNRAKLGWMHRTERDTRRDVINGIRTPLKGRRSSFVIVSIALYIRVNSFPMFVTMELIIKLVRINRREKERERAVTREKLPFFAPTNGFPRLCTFSSPVIDYLPRCSGGGPPN